MPDFVLYVEICKGLWGPAPPSSYAALVQHRKLEVSRVVRGAHSSICCVAITRAPRALISCSAR